MALGWSTDRRLDGFFVRFRSPEKIHPWSNDADENLLMETGWFYKGILWDSFICFWGGSLVVKDSNLMWQWDRHIHESWGWHNKDVEDVGASIFTRLYNIYNGIEIWNLTRIYIKRQLQACQSTTHIYSSPHTFHLSPLLLNVLGQFHHSWTARKASCRMVKKRSFWNVPWLFAELCARKFGISVYLGEMWGKGAFKKT